MTLLTEMYDVIRDHVDNKIIEELENNRPLFAHGWMNWYNRDTRRNPQLEVDNIEYARDSIYDDLRDTEDYHTKDLYK